MVIIFLYIKEFKKESIMNKLLALKDGSNLRLLLANGGDVTPTDNEGFTSLHFAAQARELETVQALLEAGAEVNARDVDGITPLYVAAHFGHTDIAKALLKAGADVNAKNEYGDTPLHEAVECRHPETAEDLLKYAEKQGPEILNNVLNATNDNGETPLMLAVEAGHLESVRCLLEKGANLRDERDILTVLDISEKVGQVDLIAVLMKHIEAHQLRAVLDIRNEHIDPEEQIEIDLDHIEDTFKQGMATLNASGLSATDVRIAYKDQLGSDEGGLSKDLVSRLCDTLESTYTACETDQKAIFYNDHSITIGMLIGFCFAKDIKFPKTSFFTPLHFASYYLSKLTLPDRSSDSLKRLFSKVTENRDAIHWPHWIVGNETIYNKISEASQRDRLDLDERLSVDLDERLSEIDNYIKDYINKFLYEELDRDNASPSYGDLSRQ